MCQRHDGIVQDKDHGAVAVGARPRVRSSNLTINNNIDSYANGARLKPTLFNVGFCISA